MQILKSLSQVQELRKRETGRWRLRIFDWNHFILNPRPASGTDSPITLGKNNSKSLRANLLICNHTYPTGGAKDQCNHSAECLAHGDCSVHMSCHCNSIRFSSCNCTKWTLLPTTAIYIKSLQTI